MRWIIGFTHSEHSFINPVNATNEQSYLSGYFLFFISFVWQQIYKSIDEVQEGTRFLLLVLIEWIDIPWLFNIKCLTCFFDHIVLIFFPITLKICNTIITGIERDVEHKSLSSSTPWIYVYIYIFLIAADAIYSPFFVYKDHSLFTLVFRFV